MSVVEKSIGELLVDNGQISAEELRLAEREAKSTGEPLSVILSRLGLAYEHHFKNALELKYGVTYVSLARTEVQPEILKKVPEAKLREHMMVPVNEKGSRITVVMVNPEHTGGLSALKEYFADRQFTPVVCTEDDFTIFMSSQYRAHLQAKEESQETNGAKEEAAEEKPAQPAPAVQQTKAEEKPALSPLAAFLAKGKEMQDKAEAEAEAKAEPKAETPKAEVPQAEAPKSEEPKAEEKPQPKATPGLKDESAITVISNTKAEAETKIDLGIPTNDETGKFDLNMLQKHIEETRNKAKGKPAAVAAIAAPADESAAPKEESKPAQVEKPAEKAEESAEGKAEEKVEEKPAEKPPEKQEEKLVEPEKKVDEEIKAPPPEVKKEARPDARDVARELAKELEDDGKASRDDEATGEFDALVTTTMEKKQAPPETKSEAIEEVKREESKEEPTAKEVDPPQEESKEDSKKVAQAELQKPAADVQEKTQEVKVEHLDQTGEDFKAVSPSSGGQPGMGECEPVASESVARPASQSKQPEALEKEGDDAAVIMLCNQILANGIAKGASTIHVEAVDKQVLVHYRIQGQLMIVRKLPKMLMPALTARFRKMGRADHQDKRLPQDGRVKVRMSGKDFNLRLTVVPHTAGGEHILVWIE